MKCVCIATRRRRGGRTVRTGTGYREKGKTAHTKEAVFERIVRERAFELAGEGHRFSDLRRWKLAVTLLNNRKDYGITGKLQYTHKFAERDYLWPIPGTEIEVNPGIGSNNPGW